ncbi:sentrin-specific protease 1-like [Olea europaea subsp. europaea]|uniref:Sentrin-specific protease 1-like n=1 Tax=Olea europaea subsp. europaea TaxID=158383 RepID=A0A8S0UG87_OLEEU|nr:sentrin-specific protease 1-like [Olea europaea subsp. europaea]
MQGQLKHDMIEIRTNMQFLSESVTAMISSSMDEILRKGKGKVNPTEDVAFASSLEPPSFDLVKRASRPARILRSPFVVGEGKVPRHDGNVIVFGNYKDNVEEADKSAFLGGFREAGKTYRDWKVQEGIEPYVKVLPALMKALEISKKDLDYNESECKQMKVTIDSTLPQHMNGHDCGVFVILYALYILRDGKCAIPHQFDAAKCRIDIALHSTNTENLT